MQIIKWYYFYNSTNQINGRFAFIYADVLISVKSTSRISLQNSFLKHCKHNEKKRRVPQVTEESRDFWNYKSSQIAQFQFDHSARTVPTVLSVIDITVINYQRMVFFEEIMKRAMKIWNMNDSFIRNILVTVNARKAKQLSPFNSKQFFVLWGHVKQ